METVNTRQQRQVTMVDAGMLDDDQFGELVDNLEARSWFIPALACLMIVFATISSLS